MLTEHWKEGSRIPKSTIYDQRTGTVHQDFRVVQCSRQGNSGPEVPRVLDRSDGTEEGT